MSDPPFDLRQMIEKAQQLGGAVQRVQEQLRHRSVDVTVGGGMVEATFNGQQELVGLRIDPQAVDPRDVEMLQDLVRAAVNQGLARAREMAQKELEKTAGLPLSGILGGPGGPSR